MPRLILPTPLAERAAGQSELEIDGATARQIVAEAERQHPGLKGWIVDERGQLRQHVHLFINQDRATLDAPVPGDAELFVVQAISGGLDVR